MISKVTPLGLAEDAPGSGTYGALFGGIAISVDMNAREARVFTAPNIATDRDFDALESVLARLGIMALATTATMVGSLILLTAAF